jgi:F-type H+-transporting ATPase subunit gamma
MEAVSAVKMRKSQQVALAARPYATAALRLLKSIHGSSMEGGMLSPLLEKREIRNILLVVVTSDKGLAGSFNANVLKKAEELARSIEVRPQEASGNITSIIAVGKKAADYFTKRGRTPMLSLTGYGDYAELEEVNPIFEAVNEAFTARKADEVYIVYTNFLSAMKQEVVVRKLLPFSEEGLEEMVKGIVPERGRFADHNANSAKENAHTANKEYIFEPSPKEIFDSILPALLKIEIYHAILEANASEHSSRMVAMRNATDNAGGLIKNYTVSLNKARQAAINKELAEITGGSEALAQ